MKTIILKIWNDIRNHIKNQRGISNLSGLVIIFCFLMFLPILSSLVGTYTTWKNLNTITTTTVNMAKKTGGFNDIVLNRYNELLTEYKIDRDKLTVSFMPIKGSKVNKRQKLGMKITYKKKLTFMQLDKTIFSIEITIPAKSFSHSHVYFKPNEL